MNNKIENQNQVQSIFGNLWSQTTPYQSELDAKVSFDKYENWTNGRLSVIFSEFFNSNKTKIVDVLDLGCGLGFSFHSLFSKYRSQIHYCGLDSIDLVNTKEFISSRGYHAEFVQASMFEAKLPKSEYDLVIALGSLHHMHSVEDGIRWAYERVGSGGVMVGWIINEQKPIRSQSDTYLRKYFSRLEAESLHNELEAYTELANKIGQAMGDIEIDVTRSVQALKLPVGKIRLQTLMYDYIIKLYSNGDDTFLRSLHQHYDWFLPAYYHQTTRGELERIISDLGSTKSEIITKVNGHFFFLWK